MANSTNFAFLHGGGQGGWVWSETISALEQQSGDGSLRAIAFDLPGAGSKRDQDPTELTTRGAAEILVSDLVASGMTDVILVGHSAAGTILPIVAAMRPDLVRRYVYLSCVAPTPGQSVGALMGTGLHGDDEAAIGWPVDPATVDPAERHRLMFCNDMADDEAAAFMTKIGRDNWPNRLALQDTDWRYDHLENKASTYILCLQDMALPLPWQEKFAARFQVQRKVRLDAGHQAMNSRPHALAEILRHEAL